MDIVNCSVYLFQQIYSEKKKAYTSTWGFWCPVCMMLRTRIEINSRNGIKRLLRFLVFCHSIGVALDEESVQNSGNRVAGGG